MSNVLRYESDGSVTVLTDRIRANVSRPNDLCFDRIYLTDPCHGPNPADGQDRFSVYRMVADKGEPNPNKTQHI